MTQSAKQLTDDRNYYRTLYTDELILIAGERTNLTELELVLTERLKELERQIPC